MKKTLVAFARIFVGALFIFSGFVKLNDPIGFSYKLEEYFEEGVLNMEFLIPFALVLAIFIVIYELLLGVTLVIGLFPKFTKWSLLLMIVFFTFLTFYSAYFNKVTDCGCFGDAIPLTPWQSFYKDIILLLFILIIFFNEKLLKPIFTKRTNTIIFLGSLIACAVFANHVLNHLPSIDFRAYKIGTDIRANMEIPEGAKGATYEYQWKFMVNGKEEIYTTEGSYPEVAGDFIEVNTVLIDEGFVPKINDFSLMKDGEEYTDELLDEQKLLVIATYNIAKSDSNAWESIKKLTDNANANGYRIIGLSASGESDVRNLKETYGIELEVFNADETAIKTIVRSNPGIVVLKNGIIDQKRHWNDASKITLD
jgi:uncharacterized membrane protein YphA (DoxX/SURF4 family)